MNRRSLVILLLLLATVVLFFIFGGCRPDYTNFPPTTAGPWVAFGDSLTEGYGASPGNDYPALLGRKLGVSIQNFGKINLKRGRRVIEFVLKYYF